MLVDWERQESGVLSLLVLESFLVHISTINSMLYLLLQQDNYSSEEVDLQLNALERPKDVE